MENSNAYEKLHGEEQQIREVGGVSIACEKLGGVSVACDCHQSRPSHMSHHNGDTQA